MKLIINAVLIGVVALLAWSLWTSIQAPIQFKEQLDKRKIAVIDKLMKNREAQELYREITGEYARSYDTLKDVLTNGEFKIVSVFGDPDDPNNPTPITYDTTRIPAKDSVLKKLELASLDGIDVIPYGNGAKFNIWADTVTYQRTKVFVCEVGTVYNKFMGEFADPKYKKYDNRYEPDATIKFGDKSKPTLAGNWE